VSQHQQRGLVALTHAQNAIEKYVEEECAKAFQKGVERGAMEQRLIDASRAQGSTEFENIAGVGREWAEAHAKNAVKAFMHRCAPFMGTDKQAHLAAVIVKALGFEEKP